MPPRRFGQETWEQARLWLMEFTENIGDRMADCEKKIERIESQRQRTIGANAALLLVVNTVITLVAAVAAVAAVLKGH